MQPHHQTVDPAVTQAKFDRELETFRKAEQVHRRRGVFLIGASFPEINLLFMAARVTPAVVVFAVKLDFTNYDVEPISVRFINPFTGEGIKADQMLTIMHRRRKGPLKEINGQMVPLIYEERLVQSHQPDEIPFLCIPGVREYHMHPAHTNDPWFDHKAKGIGTLGFLIDQLHKYGTEPIVGIMPNIQIRGYALQADRIPE